VCVWGRVGEGGGVGERDCQWGYLNVLYMCVNYVTLYTLQQDKIRPRTNKNRDMVFAATWYSAAAWYLVWFAKSCNMNQVISERCGPSVLRSSAARSAQARCSPSGVTLQQRFTATAYHCEKSCLTIRY
jgi:hypothetical protein